MDSNQSSDETRGHSIHSRRLFVSCGSRSGPSEVKELEDRECSYIELNTEIRIDVMERKLFGITWDAAMLIKCLKVTVQLF